MSTRWTSERANYIRNFFGRLPMKKLVQVTGWPEHKIRLIARNAGLLKSEPRTSPDTIPLRRDRPLTISKQRDKNLERIEKIKQLLAGMPEPFVDEVLRMSRRMGPHPAAANRLLSLDKGVIYTIAIAWMRHYHACFSLDLGTDPLALLELITDYEKAHRK